MSSHQVLIRDIDPSTYATLKQQAKDNGRSFQAELRQILDAAAAESENSNYMIREARKIRESFKGRIFSSSVELIREDRMR